MDDIRKIKKVSRTVSKLELKKKANLLEGVFDKALGKAKLQKPTKINYKFIGKGLLSLAILLVVIIGIKSLLEAKQGLEIAESSVESNESQSLLFDPAQFYGLATKDDVLYFGRIVAVDEDYYRVVDVFYNRESGTIPADSATSTPLEPDNKIILVKFGTETFAPEDELLLPREKVNEIFPLSESSPILGAISEYMLAEERRKN